MIKLIIHNCDPSPDDNHIICPVLENVGHTWIEIDGKHYGWGNSSGDPSLGLTVPGCLLDKQSENESAGKPTKSYSIIITEPQAIRLVEFYHRLVEDNIGYNLAGSQADPHATNCTESVVNALLYANILDQTEKKCLCDPFEEWSKSFPDPIPENYRHIASLVGNITTPNPNEMENRLNMLRV